MRNEIKMALELQFFLKNYKKSPSGGVLWPKTLVCDTFKLHKFRLLSISPKLQFFENFSSFGLSPDPL